MTIQSLPDGWTRWAGYENGPVIRFEVERKRRVYVETWFERESGRYHVFVMLGNHADVEVEKEYTPMQNRYDDPNVALQSAYQCTWNLHEDGVV